MTTTYNEGMTAFPFEEIRDRNGDYFNSIREIEVLGFKRNQIWAVTEYDSEDTGYEYTIYIGPSHHFVNLIGYFATSEAHDNNTYYFENINPTNTTGRN